MRRLRGHRLLVSCAVLTILLAFLSAPLPIRQAAQPQEGYGAVRIAQACGTPADMAQQDFQWPVTHLSSQYQHSTTPILCDDSWPWTAASCLPASAILAALRWPSDLLQQPFLSGPTCVQPRQPGGTPTPAPSPSPNGSGGCILNDFAPGTPGGVNLCDAVGKIFDSLFLEPIRNGVHWFMQQASFVWSTPPGATYQNTGLLAIWRVMLWIADSLLLLALVWTGTRVILGQQSWLAYADAIEILPRLLFATLAAHFSLHFGQIVIDGNNAFSSIFQDHQLIGLMDAKTGQAFVKFLQFFYGIMMLLLLLEGVLRIALLNLILIASPLWMFAWALAETERLARLGTTACIAIAFLQAIQLAVVTVGGNLLATLVTGTAPQFQLLNFLGGIATIYLALQVPRWLGQWVFLSALGGRVAGAGRALLGIASSGIAWVAGQATASSGANDQAAGESEEG